MKKLPLWHNPHQQKEKLNLSEYLIISIVTLFISILAVTFIALILNFY